MAYLENNMKKKIWKKILLSINILIPITWTISCGKFGNESNFIGIGSNSVSPLVMGKDSFMNNNPIGQYIYQNTGSGDGYKSQTHPEGFQSDFGLTSSRKNPITQAKENEENLYKFLKIWKDKKLRTVTYAFDAIGIGINLPKDLEILSKTPIIDLKELAKLYSSNNKLINSVSWSSLLKNEKNSLKWKKVKPIAIGIKGGEKTSGKAETFIKVINAHLQDNDKNIEQKQITENQYFSFVDSFNDIYLENEKTKGSVAYYSLGQINQINKNEIKVASIDLLQTNIDKNPTIEMVQNKEYRWSRPFNIIYSTQNKRAVAFANYLLSPSAQEIIVKKKYVSLSKNQILSQMPTFIPDLEDYVLDEKVVQGINKESYEGIDPKFGL